MADRIEYDEHGRARPVLNLADTVLSFDGDWDAELKALDAPPGSPPVSMRQWLIEPGASNSKLEGLQETGPMSFGGQWADTGSPDAATLAPIGTVVTMEHRANLDHHRLRSALQWLGFGVPTYRLLRIPSEVIGHKDNQLVLRCTCDSVEMLEAAHADWPLLRRHAFAAAVFVVWAAGIAFTILRSTS